jgi:hypothetical protein
MLFYVMSEGSCYHNWITEHELLNHYTAFELNSVLHNIGLYDLAIEVRSPAEAKGFPVAPVSRPAMGLLSNGYRGLSQG